MVVARARARSVGSRTVGKYEGIIVVPSRLERRRCMGRRDAHEVVVVTERMTQRLGSFMHVCS